MPHPRSSQTNLVFSNRQCFRTKDLDFLILAGCSCLLALLYHPVLDQLQANSKTPQKASSPTSRSTTAASALGHYYAVEPKRPNFRIEEEET